MTLQASDPLGMQTGGDVPLSSPVVRAAATAHNASAAQVVLRWSILRGVPVVVGWSSGVGSSAVMAAELAALFRFNLTQAEVEAFDALAGEDRAKDSGREQTEMTTAGQEEEWGSRPGSALPGIWV